MRLSRMMLRHNMRSSVETELYMDCICFRNVVLEASPVPYNKISTLKFLELTEHLPRSNTFLSPGFHSMSSVLISLGMMFPRAKDCVSDCISECVSDCASSCSLDWTSEGFAF